MSSLRIVLKEYAANISNAVDHGECFYEQSELNELLTDLDKMKDLATAYFKENRLKDVKVFQLNESDAVAAESIEDAKEFYLKTTGLSEDDAFYGEEPVELSLDGLYWEDETRVRKVTLSDMLVKDWKGTPYIILSTEG